MWELQFQGKGVESLTRLISQFKLVGIVIEFKNLEDLGDNIEVILLLGCFLKISDSVSTNVGALEKVAGPLSEGVEDSSVLSLDGSSLSGEGVWSVGGN